MKNDRSAFLALLEQFFCIYLPTGLGASANTIRSYKYAFRLLLEYLYMEKQIHADNITFSMLNHETISSFLNWLEAERNCSVSTRNQRLAALMSFSEYAQNRNFDAAAVFRSSLLKIPVKKKDEKQRAVFTVQEVAILLRMPDERTRTGYRDKVLLSVMYASGARAQEICDLTVGDILNGTQGLTLVLHGKGGKVRRVGVPGNCANLLTEYLKRCGIEKQYQRHVFSSQTHEHMTVSCVEGIYAKYISAAKQQYPELFRQKSYPPHSMRHTTASHMLEAGVPLVVIKNFLGHASLQTTQIYAQISQNTVDKHLKAWNEKWFPAEPSPQKTHSGRQIPDFLEVK